MFAGRGSKQRAFRSGDEVFIQGLSEILATLDERGTCEGLPFMPEMIAYCGQKARVSRRVEHVFIDHLGVVARLKNTVILESLRCNGTGHDGCQMGCQILWKEQWLSADRAMSAPPATREIAAAAARRLTTELEGKLWCQATQLPLITTRIPWWDAGQYLRGLRAGNFTLVGLLKMAVLLVVNKVRWWCGKDQLGMLSGPRRNTVHESLNLQPGELVEVKSREEIQATLDAHGKHRGMAFVPEMALYCGRQFRVARRVERMIQEGTGQMRQLRDTVALESVTCMGLAQRRCPRGCFHLWRECWLKRIEEETPADMNRCTTALPILDATLLPEPIAAADG